MQDPYSNYIYVVQNDLDKLHDFAVDHADTTAALTAQLLIGILAINSNRTDDIPRALPIFEDTADEYSDRWQSVIADILIRGIEVTSFNSTKTNELAAAIEKALPMSRELDALNTAEIQAFRLGLGRPFQESVEATLLEFLSDTHEKLGNYVEAQKYREEIIAKFPDSILAQRARGAIGRQLESGADK